MFFLSLGFIYFFNLLNFYPVTRFLVTPLLVTRYCVTLFSNTQCYANVAFTVFATDSKSSAISVFALAQI